MVSATHPRPTTPFGRAPRHRALAVTALAGLCATPALADPQQAPIRLGTVTVQGNADPVAAMQQDPEADRSAQGKAKVLTTTVTAATLRDRQIDSLQDFARRVDASVNYSAGNQSINLRGLDQGRVETTIDGVRMPWAADGAYQGTFSGAQGGATAFDFNSLGGIDIIKSADSSFFGTGALGGVVALRTLDPEDLLHDGKTLGGASKATFDSSSNSIILNQALAARHGDTLFLLEGGYANGNQLKNMGTIGGIGATRTETNPAYYSQGSVLGKIRQYLGNGQRLTLTGEWFDRNYRENTATSETSATDTVTTRSKNQRTRVSLAYDYQADDPSSPISEAHVLAYWQKVRTITDARIYDPAKATTYSSNYEERIALPVQTYGGTASITGNLRTGPLRHAITLGGELFLSDTTESETGFHTNVPSYLSAYIHDNYADMPPTHGIDFGLVFQDRITLGDSGWLHLTPGVRFDYYQRDPHDSALYQASAGYALYGVPAQSHGSHFSPKLLAEAQLSQGLTAYALYSQAYRAPSPTEMYLDYNSYPSYAVLGDPDLKPETSRGYEVGAKYGTAERGFKVNFFDNYYRNFIDSATLDTCPGGVAYSFGCYGYVNLPNVRIHGSEASFNWNFGQHWRTWESLSYTRGRNTDDNYTLGSVVPFRGIVGLGYKTGTWGIDASTTFAAARHDVKYLNLSGVLKSEPDVPAYAIFDMGAWYRPASLHGLSFQAGLNNIFNKTWYNAAGLPYGLSATSLSMPYYTQPGRSVKLTVRADF
jgi:hemoglobin/transferrin/lactoferrin receptor protein